MLDQRLQLTEVGQQVGKAREGDNRRRGAEQGENQQQLRVCFMTASFAWGSPVFTAFREPAPRSPGRARQYNKWRSATMSYRGFIDFAQDKRTLRGRQAGRVEGESALRFEGGPDRRMVGRFFHTANVVINTGFYAALRQRRACQQQVNTQPAVIVKAFGTVVKP